jgi:hypothetical protein
MHIKLAKWLVTRSNWLNTDATIVAPASFAIIDSSKKPKLVGNKAAT